MPEYNWVCLACDSTNDKKENECSFCGSIAGGNAWYIEARQKIVHELTSDGRIKCPNCSLNKFGFKYSKKPSDYYSFGRKGGGPLFETLDLTLFCEKCDYEKIIECKVPFFRKLYRYIFNKDIESEYLRRL